MFNSILSTLISKYGYIMTLEEVSTELKVNISQIEELIQNSDLQSKVIANAVRIPTQSLAQYLVKIMSETLDNPTLLELSSTPTQESIIIWEKGDDEMGGVSISYITASKRYMVQMNRGKKANGKRDIVSKSFKTEEEAKVYAEELYTCEIEASNETLARKYSTPRSGMRYIDFMNWYYTEKHTNPSSRTIDSYLQTCCSIKNRLISLGLAKITIGEMSEAVVIKVMMEFKNEGKSQSMLDKVRLVFKNTIKEAFYIDCIGGKDFSNRIEKMSSKVEPKDQIPFTENEVNFMLEKAKKHDTLYPILAVFSCTGMRPEELRVLEWKKLNWDNKTIKITNAAIQVRDNQSMDHRGKVYEELGPTKSKEGVRTLALSNTAIEALKNWQVKANEHTMGKDSEYIFFREGGSFLTVDQLTKRWDRFTKKIGYGGKEYNLYRFRHTFCTNLLKKNIPLPKVQKLLGDRTAEMVMKHYAKLKSEEIAMESEVRAVINA